MSTQLSLIEDAIAEKDRILAHLAGNHRRYLDLIRAVARDVARRDKTVSIDSVRFELETRNLPMPNDIGADSRLFGTLFRTKEFTAVDQRPTTRRDWAARVGRARENVTVYRLATDEEMVLRSV